MINNLEKMRKIRVKEGLKEAFDKLEKLSYKELLELTTENSLLRKYKANYEELVFFIVRDFLLLNRLPAKRAIMTDQLLSIYDSCSLSYISATEEKMARMFGDWLEDKGHFDLV